MPTPAETYAQLAKLNEEVAAAKKRLADAWKAAASRPVSDYTLQSNAGPVRLSDLFQGKQDLIVIHNMGKSCVYCTMWADGLNGLAGHLQNRAGLVLASPDDVATQADFAASRNWAFPTVSTKGSTFTADMGFEHNGSPWPGYSVFRKDADGSLRRTGGGQFGPGDDHCSIFPMMDQMDGGINGWKPRYQY